MIFDVHEQEVEEVVGSAGGGVEAVAVVFGGVEKVIDLCLVLLCDVLPDLLKLLNVGIQKLCDVVAVCHADLFPHDGRGRGNARDVLEASRRDGVHDGILGVGVLHEIDEPRRDNMRQMRNSGHRVVMERTGDDKGNGLDLPDEFLEAGRFVRGRVLRRCDDVVRILQKRSAGVVIAGPFGAGHGMAADEEGRKSLPLHLLLNVPLGGADVGQNGGGLQVALQGSEILRVLLHGSAEENHVAVLEHGAVQRAVLTAGAGVHDAVADGLLQCVAGGVVCDDSGRGPDASDGFRDGTADEAEPHEAEAEGIKIRSFRHCYTSLRQNPRYQREDVIRHLRVQRFCRMRQPVRQHRCCSRKETYRCLFHALYLERDG